MGNLGRKSGRATAWDRYVTNLTASLAIVIFGSVGVGCTRSHYRINADRAASEVVHSQKKDARWKLNDFFIYPDPRSRFFDPTCADHPPAPQDDPTANEYMRCVYGLRGSNKWYCDGVVLDPQNPVWLEQLNQYAPADKDGRLILNMESVVRLARLHNADYQRNIEEIYLAALDVAFERFQFDVQYTGGNTTGVTVSGNRASTVIGQQGPQSVGESSTLVSTASTLQANRRFAAGAQLLVGFANSFVWQLAGPDTNYAASLLNFSLIQPLLRGAGREIVLEQLTRAERSLLAAIRAQAQYRQDFYRFLTVGGNTTSNPRRIGGFQGGAGLSGFTGTGQGGFGGVGEGQNFGNTGTQRGAGTGGGGAAGFAGGGETSVNGFYGLAQRIQVIRNTQTNLNNQLLTLGLLESLADAGLIDSVQVDEFRQNVETERANLLRVQVALQDTLEFYLIDSLGLPPTLRISIDDELLKPFQFVEPKQLEHQTFANEVLRKAGDLPAQPTLEQIKDLQKNLGTLLDDVASDAADVRKELDSAADKFKARTADIDDAREKEALKRDIETTRQGLETLSKSIAADRERRDQLLKNTEPGKEKTALARTVELVRTLAGRLQEIGLYQARVRLEMVVVPKIDVDFPTAFLVARHHRLDWMNNRAALVDQWRLITLNANRLEAFLNLQIDGDVGTFGDSPLKFNGATGTLRARLIFDAPLNRVAERNLYRESLISYQRARRDYINYIDTVALGLRTRLRDLQRLRENLEIQRQALVIAIRRVDRTLQELNAPFAPPTPGQAPSQLSPVLATNLLRALSDFRSTQDNFTSVYFAFESSRLNLLFQLGVMEISDEGKWVDEPLDQILARVQMELKQECEGGGTIATPEELQYLGVDVTNASPTVQAAFQSLEAPPKTLDGAAAVDRVDRTAGSNGKRRLKIVSDRVSSAAEMKMGANNALPGTEVGTKEQGTNESTKELPSKFSPGALSEWWRGRQAQSLAKPYAPDGRKMSPEGRNKFMRELREIRSMHQEGLSTDEIARKRRMDRRVVNAFLAADPKVTEPSAPATTESSSKTGSP